MRICSHFVVEMTVMEMVEVIIAEMVEVEVVGEVEVMAEVKGCDYGDCQGC